MYVQQEMPHFGTKYEQVYKTTKHHITLLMCY